MASFPPLRKGTIRFDDLNANNEIGVCLKQIYSAKHLLILKTSFSRLKFSYLPLSLEVDLKFLFTYEHSEHAFHFVLQK